MIDTAKLGIAVVTGAADGRGRSIVAELVRMGYKVAGLDIDLAGLTQVEELVKNRLKSKAMVAKSIFAASVATCQMNTLLRKLSSRPNRTWAT